MKMRTEKEILKTMKAIDELRLTAINLGVPTSSMELMIEILDWVLEGRKSKEKIFVEHIEKHLIENGDFTPDAKVICTLCRKTIDQIYEEEKEE